MTKSEDAPKPKVSVEPLATQIQKQAFIPPIFTDSASHRRRVLTDTLTVRMNSDLVERLERLSSEKRVSTNVIIGKAVRRAVEWEPKAEQFGVVSTQKATLRFLWDHLPEEEARKLGKKSGGERGAELLLLWFKRFTFQEFVEAMRMFGAEYGGVYEFQYDYVDGVHHIMMHHELGKNFTAYMSEACAETLKLLVVDFKMVESDNQLAIEVRS